MGFDMQVLKDWVAAEDARRRAAFEAGEARVEWAVPGYRVAFGEVCEKARELGWRGSVVDLRLAFGDGEVESKSRIKRRVIQGGDR